LLFLNLPDNAAIDAIQYYRLKIVAQNGTIHYSKIVQVTKAYNATIAIYPNPIPQGNNIQVSIHSNDKAKATWQLYTMEGKIVCSNAITVQKGTTAITIPGMGLSKGSYQLLVLLKGQTLSQSVVVL
jgi:hypothetical protein